MSKIYARRQVLRGAGGFSLGLPFLASLATPKGALGQALPERKKRFVSIATQHGAIEGPNMWPDPALLTEKRALWAGHQIASGALKARMEGSDAVLSPVLRAPAAALSARLIGKMNVIRGLDIPFYIAHHTGGHLGNYARNDGNGAEGKALQSKPLPTIDQVMAWSPSFYKDLGGVKERTLITGTKSGMSWGWSNPGTRSGTVQEVRMEASSLGLFNRIFIPAGMPAVQARKPIVDRVLEQYKSLRGSNRRLSAGDRQRLDDHMSRLSELQRRLNAGNGGSSALCGAQPRPTDEASRITNSRFDLAAARRKAALYNDVIVAGFICGTSRIAVVGIDDPFSSYPGDWHADIAHNHLNPGPQKTLTEGQRASFEGAVLDLARKLDVEESGGFTYLDNTLISWTQESGQHTHDAASLPVITFGSGGGFFKTGQYIDYRNQSTSGQIDQWGKWHEYAGLTYNQYLATVLQAMGIPKSEYERPGMRGYGLDFVGPEYTKAYKPEVLSTASTVLPFLAA